MTTIRFGRDFELDPKAYELRRGGRPVRLERIPMEILLLLVESRGHLVTRQQIIGRVWGEGVFVDTDNNINAAIRKLRQALRDDAENPRFIGTVTRATGSASLPRRKTARGAPSYALNRNNQ